MRLSSRTVYQAKKKSTARRQQSSALTQVRQHLSTKAPLASRVCRSGRLANGGMRTSDPRRANGANEAAPLNLRDLRLAIASMLLNLGVEAAASGPEGGLQAIPSAAPRLNDGSVMMAGMRVSDARSQEFCANPFEMKRYRDCEMVFQHGSVCWNAFRLRRRTKSLTSTHARTAIALGIQNESEPD
jgi:hypothetical protein